MNLWIGRPGALREITDGAAEFDRSPDLGVQEFRSLGGGVTTWAPPTAPRRLSLSWEAMQADDAYHLDRLARRVDGPGPIHVIDPGSDNWLAPSIGAGRISLADYSEWVADPTIIFHPAPLDYDVMRVSLQATSGNRRIVFRRPDGSAYPVAPGMRVAWWVPGMVGALSELRIYTYTSAKQAASVGSFGAGPANVDRPFLFTIPEGVTHIAPVMWFSKLFADLPMSGAYLRQARPEDSTARTTMRQAFNAAVQAGTAPVTAYTAGTGVTLSVSGGKAMLTSTGVAGSALSFGTAKTHAVSAGEIVSLTHAVPGAVTPVLVWTDSEGATVGQSRDTLIGRVPDGAAYVWPKVELGAVATAAAIGAVSLEITSGPATPPGEGTRPYSITGYSVTPAPGRVRERDVSLELVEVTE
ncbi:hypothetical protein ACIPRL_18135 [Streptomyces sp. NPDC090085]|uniref:hypothetical protein n=1 Tax=Streptomyces sp. NPDC090085 TaxID=3365943 RepID=UPI0037FD56D8